MFKNIAASTGGIAGASQVSHVTIKLTIKYPAPQLQLPLQNRCQVQ